MVDIIIPAERLRRIVGEYYLRLTGFITDKKRWSGLGDEKADDMMSYIKAHDRDYFLALGDKLRTKSEEFANTYAAEKKFYEEASRDDKPNTSYGRFVKRMREIYNGFMQDADDKGVKNGYWLMKELGIKVCPYCNRNYTITIDTDTIKVRPEYDHFLPEALHPSLILSFYNLVPSCPECNHLKKVQEIEVNPWLGYNTANRPRFRVDTSTGEFPARPVLLIEHENKNIVKLGIKELYNEHTDYVKDILDKIQAYNPVTYNAIKKDFQGIVHTEAGLERMVWGNYTELANAGERPLSKLTADILEQYKKYL